MASSPMFSIVIPTYNRGNLIVKTIQSALAQSFTDFEVLVIDDGSTDQTKKIVGEIKDERLHYHKKDNGERGAARNYGTIHSEGVYVNFLDSDDILYPNHLEAASELIARHSSPEFFHLAYDYVHEDGRIDQVNNFDNSITQTLLFDNRLSCHGVFLKKAIALQFPFEEDRRLASSEDWELWIRLLSRFKFYYSSEVTGAVINHKLRSLHTIPPRSVIERDLFFIEKLREDQHVMKCYGRSFNRFIADRYTFFMLSLANQRQTAEVFKWSLRALRVRPMVLFNRRFIASVKNAILN